MDLPESILKSGRRLLETIDDSGSNVRPDLSWLPMPTSPVATLASSQPLLSQRHIHLPSSPANVHMPSLQVNVTTRTRCRPDPDGFDAQDAHLHAPLSLAMGGNIGFDAQDAPLHAPLSFAMGGNISVGNFSPLTTSDGVTSNVVTFQSLQGSSTPPNTHLPNKVLPSMLLLAAAACWSCLPLQAPSFQRLLGHQTLPQRWLLPPRLLNLNLCH